MSDNLSPLKGKTSLAAIVGFDVETVQTPRWIKWAGDQVPGKNQDFYMGSVVWDNEISEQVQVFFDKREMADFLLSRRFRGCRLFATNLAFDLTELYYPFREKWELLFNGSQLIFGNYHWNDRNRVRFYDTTNINRYMSVAQMGEFLGFPKMEKPVCLGKLPRSEDEVTYLTKYNIRDSQITKRYIQYFQRVIVDLGGRLGATAPSTAMDLWRRQYLKRHIKQPWQWICEEMYSACYGGRTEVFVKGLSEDLRYYDVNSLYPFIMKTQQFPDPDNIHLWEKGVFDKDLLLKEGMTWCKVRAPADLHIPILPVRREINASEKLLFPIGEFWGCWCHNELRYALLNGYEITDWKKTIWTEESFNPFADYVKDLYKLRMEWKQAGNKGQEVIKLMMNSLFGKFGQKIEGKGGKYKTLDSVKDVSELDGMEVCGDFVIEKREFFPVYVIPILSAYITSGARVHLHQLMKSVGLERVVYCDTDSIVTDGYFETSKELGKMKLEMSIEKFWAFRPKFYRAQGYDERGNPKDIARCKGIPKRGIDYFFSNGFHNNDFKVVMDKMLKFREAIKRDLKPNTIVNEFTKKVLVGSLDDKRAFIGNCDDFLTGKQYSVPVYIDDKLYITAEPSVA